MRRNCLLTFLSGVMGGRGRSSVRRTISCASLRMRPVHPRLVGYALVVSTTLSSCSNLADPEPVATRLSFVSQPTDGVAGAVLAPGVQVAVLDGSGQIMADGAVAITLTLSGDGTLLGTRTVTSVRGRASFSDLRIEHAAPGYSLKATAADLTEAVSAAFAIEAADPAQLVFVGEPSTTGARVLLRPPPQVVVRDIYGNTVLTAGDDVSVALAAGPAGAALKGATAATPREGIAVFDKLYVDMAGTGYSLQATSGHLAGATSSEFAATPTITFEFAGTIGVSCFVCGAGSAAFGTGVQPGTSLTGTFTFDPATVPSTVSATRTRYWGVTSQFTVGSETVAGNEPSNAYIDIGNGPPSGDSYSVVADGGFMFGAIAGVPIEHFSWVVSGTEGLFSTGDLPLTPDFFGPLLGTRVCIGACFDGAILEGDIQTLQEVR